MGGGSGGGLGGAASAPLTVRWPPPQPGLQTNFASSIKALNLEPMRTKPHLNKQALGRTHPQPLPEGQLGSRQQQSSNQSAPAQESSQQQQQQQQQQQSAQQSARQ